MAAKFNFQQFFAPVQTTGADTSGGNGGDSSSLAFGFAEGGEGGDADGGDGGNGGTGGNGGGNSAAIGTGGSTDNDADGGNARSDEDVDQDADGGGAFGVNFLNLFADT